MFIILNIYSQKCHALPTDMFFIKKLKTVRKIVSIETSGKYNQLCNIFVFEEELENIMGLNEKLYNSLEEESIPGKYITIGYPLMKKQAFKFEKDLTIILREVLKFNLIPFETNNYVLLGNKIFNEELDFIAANYATETYPEITPTAVMKHELYMRQPYMEFSSTFFIRVFDRNVWYALGGIIVASCLIFGLYKCLINKFKFSVIETVYFTLGMADVRDSSRMCISLRVACLFISIFMFLIMGAFSTFLTTELTVKEIILPFHNLDEIRHQTEYGYCVPDGSLLLELEQIRGYSKFINLGNCPGDYVLNYTFVENICNLEKTVYLTSSDYLSREIVDLYNGYSPCDIYVFKDAYEPAYRFRRLSSKRNFKYKRQIGRVVLQLRTSGILQYLYKKGIGIDRAQLHSNESDDLIAVQYDHVKLIFRIFLSFMMLSMIILIIEVLHATLSK